MSNNKIPDQLILDMVNGKVVPFIGAGFSISFGYLGWMELLKELSKEIGIKDLDYSDIENGDPLQIAQAFYQYYKEKNRPQLLDQMKAKANTGVKDAEQDDEMRALIERTLNREVEHTLEKQFSQKMLNLVKSRSEKIDEDAIKMLKKINKIPFHYIITTNYDKVIENIYSKDDYDVLYPGKGRELDWNEHDKTVLKIHGDIESDEGIVFTHEQYYKFMQDYGFFRNKLYTLFSTNTILMIGYGFNDINIHHTYFQFIKDYSESLSAHKKLYMLLTDFDRDKKWKTYFPYYKKYLESYNVEVIEYSDLPTFVEDLVNEYEEEKFSSNIDRLLNTQGEKLTEPLISIIQGNGLSIEKIDREVGLGIIKAITKFFRNPYVLTEEPFSLSINEDGIGHELAEKMFNAIHKIISKYQNCTSKQEYFAFINEILKYSSEATSWESIAWRIKQFFDLINHLNYFPEREYDTTIGKYFYEILSKSHPTKYLYAYDAGEFIQRNINLFPEYYIKSYLLYLKDHIREEELLSYPGVNDYWVNLIKDRLEHDHDIQVMCNEMDEELKKNNDKFEELFG